MKTEPAGAASPLLLSLTLRVAVHRVPDAIDDFLQLLLGVHETLAALLRVQDPAPFDLHLEDATAIGGPVLDLYLIRLEGPPERRFKVSEAGMVASGAAEGDHDVNGQRLAHGPELSEALAQQILHAHRPWWCRR